MKAKTRFPFYVLPYLILSCINPQDNPGDYLLSDNEKHDISNLAAGIRNYPIDSIGVLNIHPSSWYTGLVFYKPELIDTDKVIFGTLEFCNTAWPYFAGFSSMDSNLTYINGWASSQHFLRFDTTTLVKFESCSLYISNNDLPSKDTILYYLDKIHRNDYVASSTCGNCVFHDSIYDVTGFTFSKRADSTFIEVMCSYTYSAIAYKFVEVNGTLFLLFIWARIA